MKATGVAITEENRSVIKEGNILFRMHETSTPAHRFQKNIYCSNKYYTTFSQSKSASKMTTTDIKSNSTTKLEKSQTINDDKINLHLLCCGKLYMTSHLYYSSPFHRASVMLWGGKSIPQLFRQWSGLATSYFVFKMNVSPLLSLVLSSLRLNKIIIFYDLRVEQYLSQRAYQIYFTLISGKNNLKMLLFLSRG